MIYQKTQVPGPNSSKLLEKRNKFIPKGISYSFPVFAKEAKGGMITDVDGNQFIDFAAGIGVINVGHCNDSFRLLEPYS
ncbi:MAG: aminotransferase class III-fold pyridoxal phosphate-dependent enzyme [Desulfotomaculaceae bacterium]